MSETINFQIDVFRSRIFKGDAEAEVNGCLAQRRQLVRFWLVGGIAFTGRNHDGDDGMVAGDSLDEIFLRQDADGDLEVFVTAVSAAGSSISVSTVVSSTTTSLDG